MNRIFCRNSLTRLVGISRLLQRSPLPTARFSSQKVPVIGKRDVVLYRLVRRSEKYWNEQPPHKKILIGASSVGVFCGIIALIIYDTRKNDEITIRYKRAGYKEPDYFRTHDYDPNDPSYYYLRVKKDLLLKHSKHYSENLKRNTVITFDQTKKEAMEHVVKYICMDVLEVDDENLEETFYIAHSMKLENLEEHLRSLLLNNPVTMENIVRRLELAGKLEFKAVFKEDANEIRRMKEDQILWKTALPFFAEHYETITKSWGWKDMVERNSNATWRVILNLDEMYPGRFEELKRDCSRKIMNDPNENYYQKTVAELPLIGYLLK